MTDKEALQKVIKLAEKSTEGRPSVEEQAAIEIMKHMQNTLLGGSRHFQLGEKNDTITVTEVNLRSL